MAFAAEILNPGFAERNFRKNGDPMIGLLAMDRLMDIAQLVEGQLGKQLVHHLGFLQAQHVGLLIP